MNGWPAAYTVAQRSVLSTDHLCQHNEGLAHALVVKNTVA